MKARLTRWLTSLTAKYVAVFVLLVAVPSLGSRPTPSRPRTTGRSAT